MDIDPETDTYEQFEQWMKDNPTIISKKSIRNIKTCLTNNCNVIILIKTKVGITSYGYVLESEDSNSTERRYIVQYHSDPFVTNEFGYLQIAWYNNEFAVFDYKLN